MSIARLTCDLWPDLVNRMEIVEHAAQLVISRLGRHEVVEASDLVQRRNRASVKGRNTGARMTNQESEVELPQYVPRDHSGVVGLRIRVVRVRSLGGAIRGAVNGRSRGSHAPLDSAQGWCDGWRLSIRRNKIIGHVLDEQTLALD